MSATLSRRLAAIEGKVLRMVSPAERLLLQMPAFTKWLDSHGVTVGAFQRNGLAGLPRDLLRALVERLKVMVTAG